MINSDRWLRNNNLTGPIPPEIGNLKELMTLSLSYNQLSGQVPKELGDIPHLLYL